MTASKQERPTIKIIVSKSFTRQDSLSQLLYGIEEEGLPYDVISADTGSADELAYEAGMASRLQVGLGLDNNQITLQYAKLKKQEPLFRISARSPYDDIRAIGSNAARLVKRLPFKNTTAKEGII